MAKVRKSPADEVAELRAALDRLTEAVHVLTQAIDQFTDEVGWRNNQLRDQILAVPPVHLTSMPLDPLSANWQLNQVKPGDLPEALPPAQPRANLFD